MSSHYLRIFQQPKSAILLILGFASGLPLALTSGTLQAWMTVENIDLKTIGFFSLVGQAYVFKFLWSPLMDRYTPPFLGRRRGWLLTTQVLLLLAIAAMGFLEPSTQLRWMAALAVVIAFCSASQDIVFDAWKTDVLPAEERGAGAAISVLGYRLGMLVSGGWPCGLPTAISAGRDVLADGGAAGALHYRHAAGARTERRYPGSQIAGAGGSRTAARFFRPQQRLADSAAHRPL
jgi:PAT family beta-lactamase induction signal transducer AmpG